MAEGRQPYHSADVEFYESLRQPFRERLRHELHGAPDSCSVCAKLCECVAESDPEVRIRYRLGLDVDALLGLDCAGHRPFFLAVRDFVAERLRDRGKRPAFALQVEVRDGLVYVGSGNPLFRLPMQVTRRDDVPGHPGVLARVTSPRIDMELVNAWRRRCVTMHGDECANPWKIQPVKPMWLIDAHQRCLVPGEEGGEYVCLSYRRGQTEGFQTKQASLPALQKPGSLDHPDIADRLPAVVSDALHLLGNLGERYLWVDTLCLVQDDEASQAGEIERMGRIYGSASLTIVAADADGDGDDDGGLPGVTRAAPERLTSQKLIPLGEERLLPYPQGTWGDPTRDTAYGGRAWTFQASEMAGRRLVFAGNRLHWACARQRRDEWQWFCAKEKCRRCNPPPSTSARRRAPSLTVHGLPDLWAYGNLVRNYNGRDLTRDSDAPRAIAGMLSVLGRGFPGGFVGGLPAMFFDLALGWRTTNWGHKPAQLKRRTVPDPEAGGPGTHLPSWSWLGWQGSVECCYDEDGFQSNSSDTVFQTHPITTWYATQPPFVHPGAPITSWFPNRPAHCDPDRPLPPGWKRLSLDTPAEAPRIGFDRPPPGCGRYVFAHESLPYQYFWYHFPIFDGGADAETATGTLPMPYLRATTTRLRLEAYRDPSAEEARPGRRPTVWLRDPRDQQRVGHLWLHAPDDYARFPAGPGAGGTSVELVALCRRATEQAPKAYEADEFYRDHYAVLWIGWADGVAYRQGSGVVERGAWDAHPDRREIDLLLG